MAGLGLIMVQFCKFSAFNCFFLLSLCLITCDVWCITLNDVSECYVRNLIAEFEKNPSSSRFETSIEAPRRSNSTDISGFFLPRVFLWCPSLQYNIELSCPIHYCKLVEGHWTDILARKSPKNPRLIYDIGENVLLVQRFYTCKHGHRYLSANDDLMKTIASNLRDVLFPFKMYHKSCVTKALVDMVFEFVTHGVNFLQMSEVFANLNCKSYFRKVHRFIVLCAPETPASTSITDFDGFQQNVMFSFPGREKLMHIFLDALHSNLEHYEFEMNSKFPSACISTDHTFKICKNVGTYRDIDKKFVKQYENLFIVLNEKKEVLCWRMTKSTAHDEIKDMLENIQSRCETKGVQLKYVVVDKCCGAGGEANFYKSIFGDRTPVKLDLFHAVQRVVQTFYGRSLKEKACFGSEFGLIFRENDDCGPTRKKDTPQADKILTNLDNFMSKWKAVLDEMGDSNSRDPRKEIKKLRVHIEKGCLSGLAPGSGTEGNEGLHKLLNRSIATGATTLGPELLTAILTLLFFAHNKKKEDYKHVCNVLVKPCIPIDASLADFLLADQQNDFCNSSTVSHQMASSYEVPDNAGPDSDEKTATDDFNCEGLSKIVMVETIEDLLNSSVYETIDHQAGNMMKLLETVQLNCKRRDYSAFDAPLLNLKCINLKHSTERVPTSTPTDCQVLERNLDSFGLASVEVLPDGNCAFRAIYRQLQALLKDMGVPEQREVLMNQITRLGITMVSEEADVFVLRQRFVDAIANDPSYHPFLLQSDFSLETMENFRQSGKWANNLGDLVMKVCSDILGTAIFVISSSVEMSTVPFIPSDLIVNTPLYVAYKPGHYNATVKREGWNSASEEKANTCTCGKNRPGIVSCTDGGSYKTRCSCFKEGRVCTRECSCKNCGNRADQQPKIIQSVTTVCSCGKDACKKDKHFTACKDVSGKRKSRCPCLKAGNLCSTKCSCLNCGNSENIDDVQTNQGKNSKRNRATPDSYKRKRGTAYLESNNCKISDGPWTRKEVITLVICINCFQKLGIAPSMSDLKQLYNGVAKFSSHRGLREKNDKQVMGKLLHIQQTQRIQLQFLKSDS